MPDRANRPDLIIGMTDNQVRMLLAKPRLGPAASLPESALPYLVAPSTLSDVQYQEWIAHLTEKQA
jgi:hypothetical protein